MRANILIARLRITPSFGCEPQRITLSLIERPDGFHLDVRDWRKFGKSQKGRIQLEDTDVRRQIFKLKNASIPAFPVSPDVLDGEYIELTIHGEMSTLMLNWWTLAPDGADVLGSFADWLRSHARFVLQE